MREVTLLYVEVMNETEQLFVFETIFNKQSYAKVIILNTALPIETQDALLGKIIILLANMTKKDVATAIELVTGLEDENTE